MKTTIRGLLTHKCPFVDEVDHGSITLIYQGSAPELHGLATYLEMFASESISHEDLTARIARDTGASVITRWLTAGLEVECAVLVGLHRA